MLFQKGKVRKIQIDRCGNEMLNIGYDGRKRSYRHRLHLQPPKCRRKLSEKVSFCTSLRNLWGKTMVSASLAVETALVLPVFFLGMVTMISFMDIYKLQTEHLTKLCTKAKQAGMYAYAVEGSGTKEITLPDIYSYKPIGGLIPLPDIIVCNTVKVHAWTGEDHADSSGGTEETVKEKMVYMTDNGTVYHKSLSCSYLNLTINQVSGSAVSSMRNQYGEKYTACETCSRNQTAAGSVYITGQGNRYHNLASCSGLKRSVKMVKESDVSGTCACSRCG